MTIHEQLIIQADAARKAARMLALASTESKNNALHAMAEALMNGTEAILTANEKDMANGREKGLSQALLDRLMINESRIEDMAEGLRQVAALKDPVGEGSRIWIGADGIQITQLRTPIGVVGMIYEARPNVTVDAAALCLKSGNAVILKGGSEAIHTNTAIARLIQKAVVSAGIPEGSIQLVESTDREAVQVMMKMNGYIDVLIPRGGAGLIQAVVANASIPVIETGVGNCHVYVDDSAVPEMATQIVINGKTHRPGVCNATESLLVHHSFAKKHLASLARQLQDMGVALRGCEVTQSLVPGIQAADERDWAKIGRASCRERV